MILKAIVDDQEYTLNIPEQVLRDGEELFAKLDRDMDQGWQMSREWVDSPNRLERCQIVADKLLTALEKEDDRLGMIMAGYILKRLPNVISVELDLTGEMQGHAFNFSEPGEAATGDQPAQAAAVGIGLNKLEAMERAGSETTKVFKVGKGYRFSTYDQASASWKDSPLFGTEQDAEHARQVALKARFDELTGGNG